MKKTRQELVKYRDLFNNNTGEGLLEVGIIHLEDNTVVDTDPPEILQFMKGVDNE